MGNLINELDSKIIDLKTIEILNEIKGILIDSKIVDSFFLDFLWSLKI
jgi:hypothetical protein